MARSQKIILILFLFLGTILQVLPVIRSGIVSPSGIGFWGANGHDAVWHLSLINHIQDPLKIDMPVFAGEYLKNYHPFFDIIISWLSQLSHLSSSVWLFQIFPVISAFIFLYLSFIFGKMFTGSFQGGLILLALNVLANSLGWLYSLIVHGNLSGESIFWAMQSPSNQINPPYHLSLIFLLILLIIVFRHRQKNHFNFSESLAIFLTLTLLPITKAYSAVVGFGIFGLYVLRFRSFKNWLLIGTSFAFAVFLFTRYNATSTGMMVFHPFWFVNSMIESPDRIFIPYLANMRYTLEASGKIGPRYLVLMASTFALFIVGNYAWRLLGFLKLNLKNYFHFSLLVNILLTALIPTLFIQTGTSWNTIQFLYYSLFLSNFFLADYLQKKPLMMILVFSTSFLAFIGTVPNYLGKNPPAILPSGELAALNFLSSQPAGTVLTVPYDQYLKTSLVAPVPLYAYETTAYVSAYSRQLVYLEDEMNSRNSGYDVDLRLKEETSFFSQKNIYEDRGFLVNRQIDYIYLAGAQKTRYPLDVSNLYLTKIFENEDSLIYRVQR